MFSVGTAMMSLGQKVVALGVILLMNLVAFLFSPLLGIIGLVGSAPLALLILQR